jgi:hypothetical protein
LIEEEYAGSRPTAQEAAWFGSANVLPSRPLTKKGQLRSWPFYLLIGARIQTADHLAQGA